MEIGGGGNRALAIESKNLPFGARNSPIGVWEFRGDIPQPVDSPLLEKYLTKFPPVKTEMEGPAPNLLAFSGGATLPPFFSN
jgi:hypothetical protein